MKRLFAVGCMVFLGLWSGRPGTAAVINCNNFPTQCSPIVNFSVAGGPNPYVYVTGNQGNFLDPSNPSQISYSFSNSAVSEQAAGMLSTGILTATDTTTSTYGDYDRVAIAANDIFTITGPPGSDGTWVNITANFVVSGTVDLSAVGPYGSDLISGGDASIELCGPGGSFACGGDQFGDTLYTGFGSSFPGYSGPLISGTFNGDVTGGQDYLEHSYTWSQQVGSSFGVFYSMSIDTYGGTIDLTDPGTLSFNLPAGYSIQSESGFGIQAQTPEPGGAALTAIGLALAGLNRLRSWRRAR